MSTVITIMCVLMITSLYIAHRMSDGIRDD